MTLITYTMVSISVILTRYQKNPQWVCYEEQLLERTQSWLRTLLKKRRRGKNVNYKKLPLSESDSVTTTCHASPSECSNTIVNVTVFVMILSMFAVCVYLRTWMTNSENIDAFTIFPVALYSSITIACLIVLLFQPRNSATFSFMVPCVPLLPSLSIFINTFLMTLFQTHTYIKCTIWITIGK